MGRQHINSTNSRGNNIDTNRLKKQKKRSRPNVDYSIYTSGPGVKRLPGMQPNRPPGVVGAQTTIPLRITEVHWNPAGSLSHADEDYEFIRIYNPNTESVNISGWKIKSESMTGDSYTRMTFINSWSSNACNACNGTDPMLPNNYCISPLSSIIITANIDTYSQNTRCTNMFSWNPYGGACANTWKMRNDGEKIFLMDQNDVVVDNVWFCDLDEGDSEGTGWCRASEGGPGPSPGDSSGPSAWWQGGSNDNYLISANDNINGLWEYGQNPPAGNASSNGSCSQVIDANHGYSSCSDILWQNMNTGQWEEKKCCHFPGSTANYVCMNYFNCIAYGGTWNVSDNHCQEHHLTNPMCDCFSDGGCGVWEAMGYGAGTCNMGGWEGTVPNQSPVDSPLPSCVIIGSGPTAARGLCTNNPYQGQ